MSVISFFLNFSDFSPLENQLVIVDKAQKKMRRSNWHLAVAVALLLWSLIALTVSGLPSCATVQDHSGSTVAYRSCEVNTDTLWIDATQFTSTTIVMLADVALIEGDVVLAGWSSYAAVASSGTTINSVVFSNVTGTGRVMVVGVFPRASTISMADVAYAASLVQHLPLSIVQWPLTVPGTFNWERTPPPAQHGHRVTHALCFEVLFQHYVYPPCAGESNWDDARCNLDFIHRHEYWLYWDQTGRTLSSKLAVTSTSQVLPCRARWRPPEGAIGPAPAHHDHHQAACDVAAASCGGAERRGESHRNCGKRFILQRDEDHLVST